MQTGTAAFVLDGHRNVVQSCAFSVDSSTVVSFGFLGNTSLPDIMGFFNLSIDMVII